jgi:hypothetical protein
VSTVEDMGVLHILKEGEHMNSLEKFHIYSKPEIINK